MHKDNYTRSELVRAFGNGYPNFTGRIAYTGFETFEEAQAFADENNGEIVTLYHQDGQQLLEERGTRYEPFTAEDYVNDLGDNYYSVNDNYIEEEIKALSDNHSTLEDVENRVKELREIADEIESAGTTKTVIIGYGRYFETVDNQLMGYHQDVHSWSIGVVCEDNAHDIEWNLPNDQKPTPDECETYTRIS